MSLQTSEQLPTTTHTHTVVFLHGRGDRTDNFIRAISAWRGSDGRNLAAALPSFKWVYPQAPVRQLAAADPQRVSWPQWFDVWSTADFSLREEVQLAGLREMVPAVREMVRREAALLGGRWDRVVLAGISMGGATAAHALFNIDVPEAGGGRLAAYLGFCARCPFAGRGGSLREMRGVLGLEDGVTGDDDDDKVLRRTPVLLEHCVDDPLVKIENGRGLRDVLRRYGADVEWKEYPTGGHWFHEPQGLDDVVEFLKKHVIGEVRDDIGGQQNHDEDSMDLS